MNDDGNWRDTGNGFVGTVLSASAQTGCRDNAQAPLTLACD